MSGQTSRRAVLGAIMTAPAAGLITAIPVTAMASSNNAEWYRLKAEYDEVSQTEDAFNRDFHDPAQEELRARCGERVDLSFEVTARSGETVRHWVHPPDFSTVPFPPFTVHAKRIQAEWERRDALLTVWIPRLNIVAINERSNALGDLRHGLAKQLVQLPAPDLPALLWKVENLWGDIDGQDFCDSIDASWVQPVIDDCRRLLGERLRP